MEKSFLDKVEDTLASEKKEMHLDDIALKLVELFPNTPEDLNFLPAKISSALSKDVKKKESRFSKLKNGKGGFKKGIYRLKRRSTKKKLPTLKVQPKVTTQFTGCAGEHAVLSELLFWGFNSSIMAVDDGIDVVASKDNQYFHIQVKTSNCSNGSYAYKISKDRFSVKHSTKTLYICVLRRLDNNRYVNDFAIFTSSELKRLIDSGFLNQKNDLSLQIKLSDKGEYLLNNKEEITWCINNWAQIA